MRAAKLLFKQRQTAGVKSLIERLWSQENWQDVRQGYAAAESTLRLAGWNQARRVVVVRRAVRETLAAQATPAGGRGQHRLEFADPRQPRKVWKYAVLVTNATYDLANLATIGQLYQGPGRWRERV